MGSGIDMGQGKGVNLLLTHLKNIIEKRPGLNLKFREIWVLFLNKFGKKLKYITSCFFLYFGNNSDYLIVLAAGRIDFQHEYEKGLM